MCFISFFNFFEALQLSFGTYFQLNFTLAENVQHVILSFKIYCYCFIQKTWSVLVKKIIKSVWNLYVQVNSAITEQLPSPSYPYKYIIWRLQQLCLKHYIKITDYSNTCDHLLFKPKFEDKFVTISFTSVQILLYIFSGYVMRSIQVYNYSFFFLQLPP